MTRILLIDDDVKLTGLLGDYFTQEGFAVQVENDGERGAAQALSGSYAIAVLDVMMPRLNGLDVLRRIRRQTTIPVLMLTARGDDVDRITGLELGADDYVAKPCTPRELVARIRAILRRTAPVQESGGDDSVLSCGALTLAGPREPPPPSARPPLPPFGPPGPPPPARGPPGSFHGLPGLAPTLATLVASFLTALLLAWYVAKPIRGLRTAFDGVASGNLALRVSPLIGGRHDELADLAHGFDRMAERLQAVMEGQRRLLHDVSHEVRSPLARLQAAVGLLRRNPADEPAVDRIEEEIVRIDHLVGDLLKLSRIEAGDLSGREEQVDLHELLAEIVADANFEAQDSGRVILWKDGAPASLKGRPEMLRVAGENVVRNALKHAPDSRDITIETSIDAARPAYVIRVLDSGPGVPDGDLATLFTPFFRSAEAGRTEGYGLGLAIARRSVEAHGGSIRAENRPGGGLAVTLVLPLA